MKWMRMRFHANADDYRAIKRPPPGPYWCSGQGGWDEDGTSFSVVVAFIPIDESVYRTFDSISAATETIIKEFWPEATEIETSGDQQLRDAPGPFTDRFACPAWWDEKELKIIGPTYE
jgi:hypothetical protein